LAGIYTIAKVSDVPKILKAPFLEPSDSTLQPLVTITRQAGDPNVGDLAVTFTGRSLDTGSIIRAFLGWEESLNFSPGLVMECRSGTT
jgi:hypothetical protein